MRGTIDRRFVTPKKKGEGIEGGVKRREGGGGRMGIRMVKFVRIRRGKCKRGNMFERKETEMDMLGEKTRIKF